MAQAQAQAPAHAPGTLPPAHAPGTLALLGMVLVIATAGLVYELSIAAAASYLLGDSVRRFSLVIGAYLSALGIGAYLSRYVDTGLSATFVDVELATAVAGGFSVPGLFLAFGYTRAFEPILYCDVVLVGTLVGLELPLLLRILERRVAFRELVARALSVDYAGALIGSLAFSLVLVPRLGLARSSLSCGLLNALVGLAATWLLPTEEEAEARALQRARLRAVVVTAVLAAGFAGSGHATALAEAAMYPGRIVEERQSEYQRLVVTERNGGFELFLNGNLQFSSRDEYRYHEALVHPAMAAADSARRVVVGGGGDGLAVREILKWPNVASVTVVDLDRAVTDLATSYPPLVALNGGAFGDPRVRIVNEDAMRWFGEQTHELADVIVLDFPDPSTFSLGKLYTAELYASAARHLSPGGAVVVQSSSPHLARYTFWSVVRTLEATGLRVRPYQVFVPSFGIWGFALAKKAPFAIPSTLPPAALRYLDAPALRALFDLPEDLAAPPEVATNRLDNQALVGYYEDEWSRWEH
jgi:spermidine synthase